MPISESVTELAELSSERLQQQLRGRDFEGLVTTVYRDISQYKEVEYLEYWEALNFAQQHQPQGWDPFKPPNEIGKCLHDEVKALLPRKCRTHLGMFVTIGTAADVYHGIDVFFEVFRFFGKRFIATADLTIASVETDLKLQKHRRADVVLRAADVPNKWAYLVSSRLNDQINKRVPPSLTV